MKTKSCLSWFGSDSEVAAELAKMLDHCQHVTIPFCGGCAIIPHLKAGVILCADIHDAAINFYRVLSGVHGNIDRDMLIEHCSNTINHPSELELAKQWEYEGSPSARAWAFWAQCWLPRKGRGGTRNQGANDTISVRYGPGGGDNASRITKVAEELLLWSKELKRCSFIRKDFRELIPKIHDHSKGGIYADPPWVIAGKEYLHSFSENDHRDLAVCLSRFKQTTVVIRYGDEPLIRDIYQEPQWRWIDAEARTQSNAVKSEVWITNRF